MLPLPKRVWLPLMVVALLGGTALGHADWFEVAREGSAEDVQAALDAGANVHARDDDGRTALMLAAWLNENPEVVQVLLDAGANLETRDSFGATVLMLAAWLNENPDVVQVLLDAGANLETRGRTGMTALMIAAWLNENPEVVMVLLDRGADATATHSSGRSVIDYARENEHLQDTDVYWRLHDASFD